MHKIVYLPLDERPCNYAFASFLSENNPDYALVAPPKEILGEKKRAAAYEGIEAFLLRECENAYGLVLSLDMLLYGGIVPSRLHHLSEETLKNRLALLGKLKEANPALKIYAFALIMRCPSYSSSDEEPDYYERYGREIFLRGQAEHKYAAGVIDEAEYRTAVGDKDEAFERALEDFLARRRVNLNALESALSLLGTTIDSFVIPQDDSAPYGYTALDQKRVKAFLAEKGLEVAIYPGADEVGLTRLCALVNQMKGGEPKVYPVYPHEDCKKIVPLYEDRAVEKSIAAQIVSAGCQTAASAEEADILLFCNLPLEKMKNVTERGGEDYERRELAAFTEKMSCARKAGKAVAAADIAYCNGGDVEWLTLIEKKLGVFSLAGYAGWNTSSNTLGTVLCQAVLYHYYGDTATHRKFTAERVYEDVGYCGYVRKYACDELLPKMSGCDYFHADGKRGKVAEKVKETLQAYVSESFPNVAAAYEIESCGMPWSRMFEVGLTVQEKR